MAKKSNDDTFEVKMSYNAFKEVLFETTGRFQALRRWLIYEQYQVSPKIMDLIDVMEDILDDFRAGDSDLQKALKKDGWL